MAGQAVARSVSSGVLSYGAMTFALATREDEPDVRRLLRDNALGGAFGITLEREPDAFASDFGSSSNHAFIIARDTRSGQAAGLCERIVRQAWVNGQARALPYIGALRVAQSHRRRIGVLRGGFQALRQLAERPGELPFALTSITADNAVARRVLTAGVRGLPLYAPLGDFLTFAMRPERARIADGIAAATDADLPALAAFLQAQNAQFQFAPMWSAADLRGLGRAGLPPGHFLIARQRGAIAGCIAVWDQRAFRQTVIRRYPPWVFRLRHLANLVAPVLGLPGLPAPGSALHQATLSHLAVAGEDTATFLALVTAALDTAARRGFGVAALGFAQARGFHAPLLKARRALKYRTSLFLAHWPEHAAAVAALDSRTPAPDPGLL